MNVIRFDLIFLFDSVKKKQKKKLCFYQATTMDEEEGEMKNYFPVPNPVSWFTEKIIVSQADIFHNCYLLLTSPLFFLFSLVSESVHRADETKEKVESAVQVAATRVPSTVVRGSNILVKKVVFGLLGAVYMCMVLMLLFVVAVILGVGLVQNWVDEPVFMKEKLHFDYSVIHPTAVLPFYGDDGFGGHKHMVHYKSKQRLGVPVGHTFYFSLNFLVPESDYNREMGVFQVTTELISSDGNIMAKSSRPCMLRFRSWPIRMVRTFIMGLPLLLGITAETQRIKIATLRHKEVFPRTEAIRISLVPRAGTMYLPQLYEAEIVLKSELPWTKELVRRWKWTFYVWASLYVYAMLIVILLCCFKPLILPMKPSRVNGGVYGQKSIGEAKEEEEEEEEESSRDEKGLSETMRRWQESRSRRRAMLLNRDDVERPERWGSSATSISINREDTGTNWAEDDDDDVDDENGDDTTTGDSESVCCKGDE
ncbi:OLC1v1025766C1 [Oldenlandia corymbosa var. corymbosa]|uniref:OLC1v1025766C1 n=1 Tax=Oldenlandia corymbosa var. corymbosa TaxID=529605 RepID=A0AAV1C5N7_OLDCO|nr:OLC1v1025766C1 [Oldenlandia corymbosa var. corymbosa]